MLLHFDFVYAAESTRFQVPFINLALVPELASSYTLPRQIGYLRAAEMILLGEQFSAARANEFGLVTAVVPDQNVLRLRPPKSCDEPRAKNPPERTRCEPVKNSSRLQTGELIDQAVETRTQRIRSAGVRSAEAKGGASRHFSRSASPTLTRRRPARRQLRFPEAADRI